MHYDIITNFLLWLMHSCDLTILQNIINTCKNSKLCDSEALFEVKTFF